ncbi:MAG: Adenylate cyclase [Myxococcaceae bacterium]|nr:Adenylate cyclase [Myxococcaceae bacterium]
MSLRRVNELPAGCFEGVIPCSLATCSPEGVPNSTWLSQATLIDERHIALSCQFFRKTSENLAADPRAQLFIVDPRSFRQWRLDLRFARRETTGPLFEAISQRIHVMATLTQTESVFTLKSADVFEVMMISEVTVSTTRELPAARDTRDPLAALARITEGISACRGLEALLHSGLEYLTLHLGLDTVSLYLAEPSERSLFTLASRGYPESGMGARIGYGVGLIGAAAQQRMPVRVADISRELRYGRVVREQVERVHGQLEREVPLPGLAAATSLLAVPLILDGELFGVLSTESTRQLAYEERDVLLLQTAGQVLAQAVARALERAKEAALEPEQEAEPKQTRAAPALEGGADALKVRYYQADDSVFLDGEYLIKGLPGRILWLLLSLRQTEGRETYSNRELRLHPLLKLPAYKDNLEARLLVLQRRLQDKSSALRLQREQRGRLQLSCDRPIELELTPGSLP